MPTAHLDPINGRGPSIGLMLSRHAQSLDIARSLAALGETFITRLEVHENDPHRFIPACLLIRQISCLRSLCLLAVNGFYTEALGHQRGLMEALTRITALDKNPDLLNDYLIQDVLNREKLLKDILSFRSDWEPEIPREPSDEEIRAKIAEAQTRLQAFRDDHGRQPRDIKTFAWAPTGGVTHLLFGRFVMASEALHFSPKSLESLLVTENDRLVAIRIGPEDVDLDDLLLTSCKYVFVAIQSVANTFGVDVPDDIATLHQRSETLHARKADEAPGAASNTNPTA